MKTQLIYTLISLSILCLSCTGPEGPVGPPGPEIFSNVTEVEVDFSASNNYEAIIDFPSNWTVYEADIIMLYLAYETISDPTGPIQVWRALPQSILTQNGLLQYNFDHTFKDVRLFLDADYNLDLTTPADRENQLFKIAVIPASYGQAPEFIQEIHEGELLTP